MKNQLSLLLFLLLAGLTVSAQPCSVFASFNGNIVCDDNSTPGDSSDDTFTTDGKITKVYADYPGSLAGNGIRLHLDRVPLREEAMMTRPRPLLSES